MKVLLTGCEGLIGNALKVALHRNQIEMQGYDHKLPQAHIHYGDILDSAKLSEAVKDCEGIIHLAAVSRVIWGEKDPDLCWKTNYEGTENILDCALASPKRPWVLYASSREVYGNQENLPVTENTPLKPINIYGHSKAAAEDAVLLVRVKGLNTSIVRFSNVYGSITDHHDRVIPAFCRAATTGQPLKVEGSRNTFDFTHITDVVAGIIKIVEKLNTDQTNPPPFHFTTGRATTLSEAAKIANSAGGCRSKIFEAPSRTFDVSNFCGDATQTMEILDWCPKITLEDGISELVSQFMNVLNSTSINPRGRYHDEDTEGDTRLSSAL